MLGRKKKKFCRKILSEILLVSMLCCWVSEWDIQKAYAASGGQTASTDILNVRLTTDGSTSASMGGLAEGTYKGTDNAIGAQKGQITLDNTSVGGHMHSNIGQTIDLYAPSADVDYTDKIGFSGNYTFQAAGGKGGHITASDSKAGSSMAIGNYGSVITNSRIDYSTGQSVTYRKGSNGRSVSKSEATNTAYWNGGTNTDILSGFMGNINGLLAGQAQNYRAWTACAQVGTASYIQAGGSDYIVAGGGAPGVVLFEHDNGAYNARGVNGMHADQTPPLPSGTDGFYNPGSLAMSKRYRDYNGTNNINAGRIAGVTAKVGIPVSSGWGGGVQYEDMFYGWVSNARKENMGLSKVYPGYSGLARRNGSLFSTDGMNDSQYGVAINTSASEPNPYVRLTCNVKYVTVYNPTRPGYRFDGWSCSGGVQNLGRVSDGNGSGYKFKVTQTGATITALWTPLNYTITYHGNGATSGSTPKQTCQIAKDEKLNANGFMRTGYNYMGWNTKPDGSGTGYADQQTVNSLTTTSGGNVDLYAQWKPHTYKISYDGNGATGGSMNPSDHTYDKPQALNPNGYTKPGYEFNGWALSKDGDVKYKDQETVKNLTAEDKATVILYAKWKNCNPVNVKLTAENKIGTYTVSDTSSGDTTVTTWTNAPYTLYANAEDPGDGIARAEVSRSDHGHNEAFDTKTYAAVPKLTKENATFRKYETEGSTSLVLRVTDAEGTKPGRPLSGTTSTKNLNIKIDKTAPKATIKTSLGSYERPKDKTSTKKWQDWKIYSSIAYGSRVEITVSDENASAAGGQNDVSGLNRVWLVIYDTDNPSNRTEITIGDRLNGAVTHSYNEVLDVNTMFPNVMNLTYEVHAVDVAGNEMPVVTTTTERKPEIYAKVERLTPDKELEDPLQFKAGYRGRIYIYTTGWVDTLSFEWPERFIKSGEYDASHGAPGMIYNASLIMNGMYQGMDLSSDVGTKLLQEAILGSEYADENNPSSKAISMDADNENTGFTRCYEFDFWIPVYIGLPENPNHLDMGIVNQMRASITANKYIVKTSAESIATETVVSTKDFLIRMGEGSIMDNFHAAIIN